MNLLITGAWTDAEKYISSIEKLGHHVMFQQHENDRLICDYDWVEGIIGNGIFLTHAIERFTNLKYIQLTSAGYDRVPIEYINKHNIVIKNARGVYSVPMAEYAILGVLSLYKNIRFFLENQKSHAWEKKRDLLELCGQTVCIIGCGSVGTECAKRFNSLECTVVGVDITIPDQRYYEMIYSVNDIKVALSRANIVVVTIPLTQSTYHLFSTSLFDAMKPGSVFVNISRGAVVDTEALVCALNNKLGGAVLDVFEEEPLTNDDLWDNKNVIITPHNSFVSNNNPLRLGKIIIENLENL